MDARRTPRAVIDPKVRQVGFFAPPTRSHTAPPDPVVSSTSSSPPVADTSSPGNSLSPVMIPPPRHSSDNRPAPNLPVPASPLRRDSISPGSYNPSDFYSATSPTASYYVSRIGAGEGEFSDDVVAISTGRMARGSSVRTAAGPAASSFPGGGFDLTAVKASSVPVSGLTTVSVVNLPPGIAGMLVLVLN